MDAVEAGTVRLTVTVDGEVATSTEISRAQLDGSAVELKLDRWAGPASRIEVTLASARTAPWVLFTQLLLAERPL